MSARLLKKVLKEQEEVELQLQQQRSSDDDDSEFTDSPAAPFRNPFDLLDDDDDDDADGEGDDRRHVHQLSDEEKVNSAETSNRDTIHKNSSMVKVVVRTVSVPNVKSKKKNKKKKKIKEDTCRSTENAESSSDLMLENLSLGARSSSRQRNNSLPVKAKLMKKDSPDKMVNKQCKSAILQVDPKFLNAESEMRRIFGSKVVNSHERSRLPTNTRQMRGGRRGIHNLKKTIIVSPCEHWPRWDGSLSMEILETKDGVNYFRYVHSSSYAQTQRAFEAAKAIHDLNGIASILLYHPYHIDSLITMAEYFKFTGEHQMSADAIAKCLYAMECAWHPQFASLQDCQLKYIHDANKPFFSSLFTHMKNMDRRGCHRSALELCKLLLSLDPDDPMGARLCIDYYSLRAEEYTWLEKFAEEYGHDNSLWLFPNFSYSIAISRFYLERKESSKNKETGSEKASSFDLIKQALMLHPSVLRKLEDKVPLRDRMWTNVLNHTFFKSEQTECASLDHLISIYVERSYLIWRLPDLQKFVCDSALLVIDMVEKQGDEARDWACVRNEAFSSEKNEYSHLLVSDFSDSMPTMPPENLQDFIVDARGGQEFAHIPEEHEIHDVSSRNALAVLFESMLPWVNYGTLDGDDAQHDLHEQGDEE
ncbi:hypothetical protein ACJIZ3_010073 [Penstemon smallii]|uniref:Transcription factor 25 n=1 Tax=Penstemon smallii TaxID=265156 RepID=A0ABD3TEA4_9LAMI